MTYTIPRLTDYSLTLGDRGIVVWGLQRVLNRLGYPTVEDGDFGTATEANVVKMQARIGVGADGKAGPATQLALGRYLSARQETAAPSLPRMLLWSTASYESGGYLGAVNWSVAGGVDCGITQRRVYQEQYGDQAAIKRAFDPVYQLDLSSDRLVELYSTFSSRPGVLAAPSERRREFAYRLATLNHNYPTAADQISKVGVAGLSAYWTQPQPWTKNIVLADGSRTWIRFPDGAYVKTPLEWCQRYALGAAVHGEPGQAVKLVATWS